uniref:SEC14-like protein 5 n=2 Tax=Hirondellea gigas TaxID=1518452 RepID=A0A6A7FYP6_9CRUS
MVQSYQSPVRVYKHPFELIMMAYERRFPSCEMIPIMAGTDIVREEELEEGAIKVVSRRCRLHAEAPYLLKKIMGVEFIYFIQTNTLRRRERVLEIEAYNESFSARVIINETCKYSVHPENSDWTCFEQTAQLDVKSFFGFESTVEKIAMKQYSLNISKGKEIISHYLEILEDEGITSVPLWQPDSTATATDSSDAAEADATSADDTDDHFEDADGEGGDSCVAAAAKDEVIEEVSGETRTAELESEGDGLVAVTAPATEKEDGIAKDGGEEEDEKGMIKKEKEGSLKKERKDSLGAPNNNKKKKKDSVGSDGAVREEGSEDRSKGTIRKGSLQQNESLSIEKDNRYKLDADYIAQCLGDLTPLQESRLVQLKKWVNKLQKGKAPSDTTLLRFLRARDFHLEKSREMLSQSLSWRKRNQVDKIISEYKPNPVLVQYFPGGWHYHDKWNRPLFLLRMGQMDVKGLVKSAGEESLLQHTLAICEEGLRLTEEATRRCNRPITTWTLLIDLEGLNMRHLWRPGIRTLLTLIELVENNYPETMSHVLIIRAPRVFPILWTLVSTFIDDHTKSKFLFYGGNDYQDPGGLVDYMSEEFIPEFLGGKCKSLVCEGGLVPKNLYLPGEEVESVGKQHLQLSDQSIYQSVSLSRGQVHEVLILIEEPGAVICWDFDVLKSDVTFNVIRTKVPLANKTDVQQSGGSHAAEVTKGVSAGVDERGSVLEKSWKEGEAFFRMEPSLLCHDGESIQGSHVTRHTGTFLLQWKQHESTSHTSPLDILDNITAPKAQIMYYFETLKSSDYKGSMSSLQSCQSGFSSLSSNTSKSLNSSCPSR